MSNHTLKQLHLSISWPSKPPTKATLWRTLRIQYTLECSKDSDELDVMATNLWSTDKPYPWIKAFRPPFYTNSWRQWILASIHLAGNSHLDLKRYLRYMELILDALWIHISENPSITQLPLPMDHYRHSCRTPLTGENFRMGISK